MIIVLSWKVVIIEGKSDRHPAKKQRRIRRSLLVEGRRRITEMHLGFVLRDERGTPHDDRQNAGFERFNIAVSSNLDVRKGLSARDLCLSIEG